MYSIDYCKINNKCMILQWLLNFDVISTKLENGKKKNEEEKKERERERNIKRRTCVGQ